MQAFFISPIELDDAEIEGVGGADGTIIVETCTESSGRAPTYKED